MSGAKLRSGGFGCSAPLEHLLRALLASALGQPMNDGCHRLHCCKAFREGQPACERHFSHWPVTSAKLTRDFGLQHAGALPQRLEGLYDH